MTPPVPVSVLVAGFLLNLPLSLEAQSQSETYRVPPAGVLAIVDAPAPAEARVIANRKWVMSTERDANHTTIARLAEPLLLLAGRRIKAEPDWRIENKGGTRITLKSLENGVERVLDPPANGRIDSVVWVRDSASGGELAYSSIHDGRMAVHLYDAATGVERRVSADGLEGRIDSLTFTRDGRLLAFTATTRAGVQLWLADTRDATARRVPGVVLDHVSHGLFWTEGKPPLIACAVPANRGAPPSPDEVPTGPIIQESYGRAARSRTFQDLLKDPHDEALFEHYLTLQIIAVSEGGKVTPIGPPGIHTSVSSSPSGKHLLVRTVHRPYSYQVPMPYFPTRTAVWTAAGAVVKVIEEAPLRENLPIVRDAVVPGIRHISWRPDVPDTLVLVEALDGGDPRQAAPKRDRISLLSAPFRDEPAPFLEMEMRYGDIEWAYADFALVTERSAATARIRTWAINPARMDQPPRLLWDRSSEDRYTDPGTLVLTEHSRELRRVPLRSSDGQWVYLRGAGEAREGARPFLDRLHLGTLKTERLWRSAPPHHEEIVELLDPEARGIIFSRESPEQRPNLFLRPADATDPVQLTDLPDPAPWSAHIRGELVRYRRADGIELSATLYLPPGYDRTRDGALPFLFWAYPREFLTTDGASQVTGSSHQFRRPMWRGSRHDHLLALAMGFGVLDNPAMPIVGRAGREPNDEYIEQLVASARAAVDFVAERGLADRNRIAVGGHSYGAFMTANLLAHSDLFCAGIARSGAYNRTLTPFGFQAEPRTYWQAPETYYRMSPFSHVTGIKEPILLIHGMRDSNSGTFPLQSERLYSAIKGHGGDVRYVQLPLEDHGYSARESQLHVIWEMLTWLDRHAKGRVAPVMTSAMQRTGQ